MALIALLSYKTSWNPRIRALRLHPLSLAPRRSSLSARDAAPIPSQRRAAPPPALRRPSLSLSFYLLTSPPLSPKSSSLLPRSGASSHLPLSREGLGCFRHAWIRSLTSRGPPRWSAGGGCASRGACVASSPCGTRPCQDRGWCAHPVAASSGPVEGASSLHSARLFVAAQYLSTAISVAKFDTVWCLFSVLEVEELRCIMVDSARGGWQGVLDLTVGHPGYFRSPCQVAGALVQYLAFKLVNSILA